MFAKELALWALTSQKDPALRPPPPEREPIEITFARRAVGPAIAVISMPPLVITFWMIFAKFDGSLVRFIQEITPARFYELAPRPTLRAVAIVLGWVFVQGVLMLILPGKTIEGPVTPKGNRPRFVLNGILAWLVTHVGLAAAFYTQLLSPTALYESFGEVLITLNIGALLFCAFLYWKGRRHPSTSDAVYTGFLLLDFFQGVELHPSLCGINLKQLINCRVSMMGWSALYLCFAWHQLQTHGTVTTSMMVSAGLLIAYLFKFFWWEGGYFHSLDIMHDRFGYYICWGVLVWVPVLYTSAGQYFANHPIEISPVLAILLVVLGLVALWMNYAADKQRQLVRTTAGASPVWGKPAKVLRAAYITSDGKQHENLLLVSGYWGITRHFHYLPELVLALCCALPAAARSPMPYLYFVFLAGLLVDRANRDDLRCAKKYGATWDKYREIVPYKIVPGVY